MSKPRIITMVFLLSVAYTTDILARARRGAPAKINNPTAKAKLAPLPALEKKADEPKPAIIAETAKTDSVTAQSDNTPAGPPDKMSGVNLGGNLVQGYTYNPHHPPDGYNGTLTWTDRANEYQLNQANQF